MKSFSIYQLYMNLIHVNIYMNSYIWNHSRICDFIYGAGQLNKRNHLSVCWTRNCSSNCLFDKAFKFAGLPCAQPLVPCCIHHQINLC